MRRVALRIGTIPRSSAGDRRASSEALIVLEKIRGFVLVWVLVFLFVYCCVSQRWFWRTSCQTRPPVCCTGEDEWEEAMALLKHSAHGDTRRR